MLDGVREGGKRDVPSSMALDDGANPLHLAQPEPEVLAYTQWMSVLSKMPAPSSHPAARTLIWDTAAAELI